MRYAALIAGAMLLTGLSAAGLAENLTVQLPGVKVVRIQVSFEC